MRYTVDADKCQGHGQCYIFAPTAFSPDDEGFNSAAGTTVDVPAELEDDVRRGASTCPEGAIDIL
jgi:ferredoxin